MEKETMSPGEEGDVEIMLAHPERFGIALRAGAKFEIREGSRVVGRGIIEDIMS